MATRCTQAGPLPRMRGRARVRVGAGNSTRLERLARYVTRPALAQDRLALARDGSVVYRFKKPWRNGKQAVVMDPLTFLSRLAALIPPPRFHTLSYYGVLAPAASHAPYRACAAGAPLRRDRSGELRGGAFELSPEQPASQGIEHRREETARASKTRAHGLGRAGSEGLAGGRSALSLRRPPPRVGDGVQRPVDRTHPPPSRIAVRRSAASPAPPDAGRAAVLGVAVPGERGRVRGS